MDGWVLGLDAGSTAVKAVVLSPEGVCVFRRYERHRAKVRETVLHIVEEAVKAFPDRSFRMGLTGMGGMALAEKWGIPFTQELAAEEAAIRRYLPDTDAAIEIGGEDAKVTYFPKGKAPDQRMNRDCAGGTGAFLDHLAALLGTDAAGLNRLAAEGRHVYPIASRCGVFARTDVQGLLNEGADRRDIALSVFQAIVQQVLSGLSQGRPLRGRVAFLGGPLSFMPVLRDRFRKTLQLPPEDVLVPKDGVYYGALGAALSAAGEAAPLSRHAARFRKNPVRPQAARLPPLFTSPEEYRHFQEIHGRDRACRSDLSCHKGPVWLGVDAGSTTLKAVLMDGEERILRDWYWRHHGDVLGSAKRLLTEIYDGLPEGTYLAAAGVTGYGEGLLRKAFHFDTGEVETEAHVRGAQAFCPDVTAILDIGGQDMKYCRLERGILSEVSLNGACSSGCGAFLETFAETFHMSMEDFAKAAVCADGALDLGARCTVLMNSKVKELQRDGIGLGELAAGLSISVVKNALYKVVRLTSPEDMGRRVVVEGGAFCSDAVLRAFERELGRPVIRPDIAGLMGAYGMALLARERKGKGPSALLGKEAALRLTTQSRMERCSGCGNHCQVSVKTFSNGSVFVTGNRCARGERLAGVKIPAGVSIPDGYEWARDHLFRPFPLKGKAKGRVGIPAVLDMWEDFPYWSAFFAALGYRAVRSDFAEEGMAEAAATLPEGVHCHACFLAHVHVWDLLRKPVDFIWMPSRNRGGEEPEIDERRHAAYGDTIASSMGEAIRQRGIPFLHPALPAAGDPAMAEALAAALPQIDREDILKAVKAGEAAQLHFYEGLMEETRRALLWMKETGRPGIILCGRPYQRDPQIHKGIPHMITSLGAAVLSGEGLTLLGAGRLRLSAGDMSLRDLLLGALPYAEREARLQYVQLHSISCGYDGLTRMEVEDALRRAGKLYTVLSLDQGMNNGAIRIRLRSLLAEAEVLEAHPEAKAALRASAPFLTQGKPSFLIPSLSWYGPLLAAAFQGEGYEADLLPAAKGGKAAQYLPDEAGVPVLSALSSVLRLSSKEAAGRSVLMFSSRRDAAFLRRGFSAAGRAAGAVYFHCAGGAGSLPVTRSLLHRFFAALFIGDFLLRGEETLAPEYRDLLENLAGEAGEAVRGGSFAAYESFFRRAVQVLAGAGTGSGRPVIGIDGDPFLRFSPGASPAALIQKAGAVPAELGLGEWQAMQITWTYWASSFGGDRRGLERCMAARNAAEAYRKPYEKAVQALPFLGHVPEGWGMRIYREARFHEGDGLREWQRNLLLRGAEAVISLRGLSAMENGGEEEGVFQKVRPDLPLLTEEYFPGKSDVNRENRIRLLLHEVENRRAGCMG